MANEELPATPANAFLSRQSALAFPVTSGAITLTWQLSGLLYAPLGTTVWVPFVLAVLVGIAYYFMSNRTSDNWPDRINLILVTFFNTVTVAAAAVGLSATAAASR
ncbi:MAG: hypothetical protein ACJ8CR_29740 [Roseiflexaceae bacterium]